MNARSEAGFSVAKLFIILLTVIIVVGGSVFGFYLINRQSQISTASSFMDSFIKTVENKEPKESYSNLSDGSKNSDLSNDYLTWYFWVSDFKNKNLTIDEGGQSISYKNSSMLGTSLEEAVITFTYPTSVGSPVFFTVKYNDSSWVVSDYGAI